MCDEILFMTFEEIKNKLIKHDRIIVPTSIILTNLYINELKQFLLKYHIEISVYRENGILCIEKVD